MLFSSAGILVYSHLDQNWDSFGIYRILEDLYIHFTVQAFDMLKKDMLIALCVHWGCNLPIV